MFRNELLRLGAVLAGVVFATGALAHAPSIGPHGGLRLHWGGYHVELQPMAETVNLHVTAAAGDTSVDVSAAQASGRAMVGGKLMPLVFTPAGGNRLTAPGALTGDWKAQVTLRLPKGQPVTIQFSETQRRDVANRGPHH
jgi:hypothetical protein